MSPAIMSLDSSFEEGKIYVSIYEYVREYMARYDPSHDFEHVKRVLAVSRQILMAEKKLQPHRDLDYQAVVLGALLHDVGDRKYILPGEVAETMITDILTDNGCLPELAHKIALIADNVSYTGEVKRPAHVAALIREHPELAIVQDADRLDAIGAIGIGRVFSYGAAKAPERGLQGSVDHFAQKLYKIEDMMKTETGRTMARERTERLRIFEQWWTEEYTTAECV